MAYDNRMREFCIWVNEQKWFHNTIIVLILLNSVMLGTIDYNYIETEENTHLKPKPNVIAEQAEHVFTVLFTLELVIKVIAMGLLTDQYCYLKNNWNWLDAAVVISSILSYFPSIINIAILRTFRLFKPLKSLYRFPKLQELVVALLGSLSRLFNVLILLCFIMFIFAIFGLQIWNGVLHYRCRLTPLPVDGDWIVAPG
jgi:hypothetical protein